MTIAEYFQQFRFKPNILNSKKWLEEFVCNAFYKNDVILNLNYDCFLEGLLDYFEIWNPNRGYGAIENMLLGKNNININDIQILKIHGSEHFTLQKYVDNPESAALSFEFNKHIFPKSAAHSFLSARPINENNAKPYIIAPSYVKIPTVEIGYLMIDAIEAVNKSKNVIIVGCGLRPEDIFLWLLLTRILRHPEWKKSKIVIISPEACSLGMRIKQYWGVNVNESISRDSIKTRRCNRPTDCGNSSIALPNNCIHQTARSVASLRASLLAPLVMQVVGLNQGKTIETMRGPSDQ